MSGHHSTRGWVPGTPPAVTQETRGCADCTPDGDGPCTAACRAAPAPADRAGEQLAAALRNMIRRYESPDWVEWDWRSEASRLLPIVERAARERAAAELESASRWAEARCQEAWTAYKSASPSDPRRANPHTEGESDAFEFVADHLSALAAALRAAALEATT